MTIMVVILIKLVDPVELFKLVELINRIMDILRPGLGGL